MAWTDSYEPDAQAQYKNLKYWLSQKSSEDIPYESLYDGSNSKCPFKKLEARRLVWDDDDTLELEDNAFASSGAFMAVPRDGHWVRLFVQANNNAGYFWENLPERGLANVPTSWGFRDKDGATANSWQIIAFGETGTSTLADGFIEIVLIGRPGSDPRDILTIDVDEDWGWKYQDRNQKAFTLYLDGLGGSDGSNWESEVWITLLDYGSTGQLPSGAIVPKKNSLDRDVNLQGLIPTVPNGYYWDFATQEVISIDDGSSTDFGTDSDTTGEFDADDFDGGSGVSPTPPKPENLDPEPASSRTLKGMWELVQDGKAEQTPFKVFQFSGGSSRRTWTNDDKVRVENFDRFWSDSGAVLMEIREGAMIELKITNENAGYFSDIGNSLLLDPQLVSENFSGGDSSFTIKLYGNNLVAADVDKDYSDISGAFGGFTITTDKGSYTIDDPADNEFIIEMKSFGYDERIPEDDDDDIIVNPNPGGGETTPTDPFDLIDGADTPFDETDGLTDRLIKSTTFGINGSFKAIEAAFEGFMIALPALIVIGSAVIVAKLAIGATEKGASRVVGMANKAKDSITNVSIEGVN